MRVGAAIKKSPTLDRLLGIAWNILLNTLKGSLLKGDGAGHNMSGWYH